MQDRLHRIKWCSCWLSSGLSSNTGIIFGYNKFRPAAAFTACGAVSITIQRRMLSHLISFSHNNFTAIFKWLTRSSISVVSRIVNVECSSNYIRYIFIFLRHLSIHQKSSISCYRLHFPVFFPEHFRYKQIDSWFRGDFQIKTLKKTVKLLNCYYIFNSCHALKTIFLQILK